MSCMDEFKLTRMNIDIQGKEGNQIEKRKITDPILDCNDLNH